MDLIKLSWLSRRSLFLAAFLWLIVGAEAQVLKEKPQVRGISLPGMPIGAPGMPGPKEGPFKVYEIQDGPPKVYATE